MVLDAVAHGDLSKKIGTEYQGALGQPRTMPTFAMDRVASSLPATRKPAMRSTKRAGTSLPAI